MASDTFVKANDFSGKTVISFCISASSGLGQSEKLLPFILLSIHTNSNLFDNLLVKKSKLLYNNF